MVSYPPICWCFHGKKGGQWSSHGGRWDPLHHAPWHHLGWNELGGVQGEIGHGHRSRAWPLQPLQIRVGKWWGNDGFLQWCQHGKTRWNLMVGEFYIWCWWIWLPYFQIAILDSIYNIPTVVSRCWHFWQHLGRFSIAIAKAINALNGRIDFTNKDLSATQESLHTTQNSLSDCFNEVGDGQTVMRKMWILMDSSLVLKKRLKKHKWCLGAHKFTCELSVSQQPFCG